MTLSKMKFKKILLSGFTKDDLRDDDWKRVEKLCEEKILLPADDPQF